MAPLQVVLTAGLATGEESIYISWIERVLDYYLFELDPELLGTGLLPDTELPVELVASLASRSSGAPS